MLSAVKGIRLFGSGGGSSEVYFDGQTSVFEVGSASPGPQNHIHSSYIVVGNFHFGGHIHKDDGKIKFLLDGLLAGNLQPEQ